MTKAQFSIGEVSKICNISRKTLRYYDSIGLITSHRHEGNNYRYYDQDALLAVPVIKYYKQMGFTLKEMRSFIEGAVPNVYRALKNSFLAKISELEEERLVLERKYTSVKDWYELIVEAQNVIDHEVTDVSVKYIEATNYLYIEQNFEDDIKAAIINIDWTNFLEKIGNEITGPVIINFPSVQSRMEGKPQVIRLMQKTLLPYSDDETSRSFGGCMAVSSYHIGPHETLDETYKRIFAWAKNNGYFLDEESFERYVTDYWTTGKSTQFVTEVIIKASRTPDLD